MPQDHGQVGIKMRIPCAPRAEEKAVGRTAGSKLFIISLQQAAQLPCVNVSEVGSHEREKLPDFEDLLSDLCDFHPTTGCQSKPLVTRLNTGAQRSDVLTRVASPKADLAAR